MSDEPRRHPIYLLAVGVAALMTNPVLFVGQPTRFVAGLPSWLWWSIGWTVALSALVAFGFLRYWTEDGDDR